MATQVDIGSTSGSAARARKNNVASLASKTTLESIAVNGDFWEQWAQNRRELTPDSIRRARLRYFREIASKLFVLAVGAIALGAFFYTFGMKK